MSNRFAAGLSKLKDVSGKTPPAPVPFPADPAPTEQRRPAAETVPSRQGKVEVVPEIWTGA